MIPILKGKENTNALILEQGWKISCPLGVVEFQLWRSLTRVRLALCRGELKSDNK